MATDSSEEPQIDDELLGAMLKFDEMLRSGKLNSGIESSDDHRLGPTSEVLRMARDALCELEAAVPRRSEEVPSWVPTCIGRFEVHSVLGVGGFAVVYLAWDPALSRFVALKIPRPHSLVDAQLRRRFVKEGRTAAQLDHPGIVPVFEAGEDGDVPYIACAWCEGPTLAKWLAERTSPIHPHAAAMIVRNLAEAVQYSHERKVLHRDIKPGNILLFPLRTSSLSEFPFSPRLADFGLACLMQESNSDSLSGAMIGTPQFMAPEQLAHDINTTGPATDVYALGAVLYNLVVGHPAFGAATITDTLRQIEELDAVPPHVINPHISTDLSWIILKCLEKRPTDRYLTASDLAADLQRFLDGRPVLARRTAWFVRIQKWFRRRPLVTSLALIAALLTCLLLALGFQYANAVHDLHGELEHRQTLLKDAEQRLDDAQQIARRSKRDAESLLYSANVLSAGLALRRSDPNDASLHLKPWILDTRSQSEVRPEFAGKYVWNQLNFSSRTIAQTQFAVWDFALSPDGKLLAAAGNTGRVLLFDRKRNFEPAGEMFAADSEVNSLCFSKDGKLLVAATDSGEVIVWDASTRTILRRIRLLEKRQLYSAEFIADTYTIVAGGQARDLFIVDANSGAVIDSIPDVQNRTVESLAIAYDGQTIAAGGSQCTLTLISLDGQRKERDRRVFLESGSPLNVVQFSDDAQMVYAGDSSGYVAAFNVVNGELIAEVQRPDGIQGLAVGRDGRVVFGDKKGVLAEFPPLDPNKPLRQPWAPSRVWTAHGQTINAIVAVERFERQDAEYRTWISSDRSGVISMWVQEEGHQRQILPVVSDQKNAHRSFTINSLAAGPEDSQLYRLCDDQAELWDVRSSSLVPSIFSDEPIASIATDSFGQLKFAGTSDGRLIEFHTNGSVVRSLEILKGERVSRISYTTGSRAVLAEVSGDDDVRWVETSDWRTVRSLSNRSCSLVSPFGWLATAMHGTNQIEVYSQNSSRLLATINAHQSTVKQLVAAQSRPWMMSVSSDRTAILWDTRTWKLIHVFSGHAYPIHSCAISPDQQTLATGDESGTIKLWHLDSGRELMELSSLNNIVTALTFSQTGRYLFALKSDGTVVIFDSGP